MGEERTMEAMTHQTMTRRAFAIAGVATVFSTRTALAQPATPASPALDIAALYRVDLPATSLPPAPVAVGAAGAMMTPGTTVVYPEGSAGRSVAVDHVLTGSYEAESGSEAIHIDAAGTITDIPAGQATTVAAGETIVFLRNEAGQRITAGEEETRTLTAGLFSLQQQGTNETTVDGMLEQEVLGGTIVSAVPEQGVTITFVPAGDASGLASSVAQVPVTLDSGEQWVMLVLPLAVEATPVA
jgi:hypothetical protein